MHPAADVSWCQLQVGNELVGGMRGINGKRDRPVELLVRAYLSKGFFLSKGSARRYQQLGNCHRTPPWDHDSYPCTVSTAALTLAYQNSLAPVANRGSVFASPPSQGLGKRVAPAKCAATALRRGPATPSWTPCTRRKPRASVVCVRLASQGLSTSARKGRCRGRSAVLLANGQWHGT